MYIYLLTSPLGYQDASYFQPPNHGIDTLLLSHYTVLPSVMSQSCRQKNIKHTF